MRRVRVSVLGLFVGAMLAAATFLLCDTYAGSAFEGQRPIFPRYLGSLFTAPVQMSEPSDLRAYVLPAGLAVLLIFAEFFGPLRFSGLKAFEKLALAVVLWALVSAALNDSWALSRGWVFSFAAGAGCAALLSRLARWNDIVWGGAAAAVVALIGCSASLWHFRTLGEAFVGRPVGPVTLISMLGAAWCVIAITFLFCHLTMASRRRAAEVFLGAGFALLAWRFMQAGGRGAGLLGLFAGVLYAATMIVCVRLKSVRGRAALMAAVVVCVTAGSLWIGGRLLERGQTYSSRLAARLLYVKEMVALAPQWCVAGCGPDMFVCRMTTALARQRAETPRFLPGNVDLDAHNEWLQAVFEMGILGGLLYIAIPVLVIFLAGRAFLHSGSPTRRTWLLACSTGLVTMVVGESVSINLRYPPLSAWYWILIGLLLAMVNRSQIGPVHGSITRRGLVILAAGLIVAFVGRDILCVRAHAAGRAEIGRDDPAAVQHLRQGARRMGAAAWLAAQRDLGNAALNLARRGMSSSLSPTTAPAANDEWAHLAIDTLRALYDRCQAYPSAGFRLGEALAVAGRAEEAKRLLHDYLTRVNPYETQANLLYATIGELPPMDELECVRRGLRDSEWQTAMDGHAAACFQRSEITVPWQDRVRQAEKDVQLDDPERWQDRLAPETLRLEAVRLIYENRLAEAAKVQLEAAGVYRRLNKRMSAYRRTTRPLVDASLRAGEIIFSLDPAQYERAFELVSQAEVFAIGDLIRGERPSANDRASGAALVISAGETTPPGLKRLWQISAALHLAMGEDEKETNVRILLSLPPERRSPTDLETERRRLASQVVSIFKTLPETQRPKGWARLMQLSSSSDGD